MVLRIDRDNSGGTNPRYNAKIPSLLTICLPVEKIVGLAVMVLEPFIVCIRVLIVSKGKPITVPMIPALKPVE